MFTSQISQFSSYFHASSIFSLKPWRRQSKRVERSRGVEKWAERDNKFQVSHKYRQMFLIIFFPREQFSPFQQVLWKLFLWVLYFSCYRSVWCVRCFAMYCIRIIMKFYSLHFNIFHRLKLVILLQCTHVLHVSKHESYYCSRFRVAICQWWLFEPTMFNSMFCGDFLITNVIATQIPPQKIIRYQDRNNIKFAI